MKKIEPYFPSDAVIERLGNGYYSVTIIEYQEFSAFASSSKNATKTSYLTISCDKYGNIT